LSELEQSAAATGISLDETAEELYEQAPCGYVTTTVSGRIVKLNRTLLEWLGYDRHELLNKLRLVDLLTPGGKIFCETHISLLLRRNGAVNEIALDFKRKDGGVLPALVNARQKRDASGQPVLNRFTIFNASDRRMYERQLLAARDLFETTLASIGDGVVSTDDLGAVTFMNPVAAELSGWDPDAAVGKPIENVLVFRREDTREPIENPVRNALRSGRIVGLENHTILVSKDGREIVVDDSASPIRDSNDSIVGAVLVFRDVSERRRSERALAEAHNQLEKTASELRRSNEDLSQFAYVASHDLRSPLKTVTSFVQLLELRYADRLGDGKELLRHITDATKRMAALIEDLLRFSTVASSGQVSTELVDANNCFSAAVENLHMAIAESGAIVTKDALPQVAIDETSLVQLLQNLIGNAIRYRSKEQPRIHISAERRGGSFQFSCSDNGMGIAPEYYDRIFEPFKRLHGSDIPGSGIGLALCKKIVERHGGRIWVESEVGKGSTFYLTIPVRGK
jgi:PAS domain S-box-containing protein